jgi:hypothetical protein
MIAAASAAERQGASAPVAPARVKDIKAYGLDFNRGARRAFAKPGANSLLPLEGLLARPVHELKGDDRNIAVFARACHGASLDAVRNEKGGFVEPGKQMETAALRPG